LVLKPLNFCTLQSDTTLRNIASCLNVASLQNGDYVMKFAT